MKKEWMKNRKEGKFFRRGHNVRIDGGLREEINDRKQKNKRKGQKDTEQNAKEKETKKERSNCCCIRGCDCN